MKEDVDHMMRDEDIASVVFCIKQGCTHWQESHAT